MSTMKSYSYEGGRPSERQRSIIDPILQRLPLPISRRLSHYLSSESRLGLITAADSRHRRKRRTSFVNLPNILVLCWVPLLLWGERIIFNNKVDSCAWNRWEKWPSEATPHRLILVADPQLVDPHTYPGRPWPLSTMTVRHTDMYIFRAYSRLQRVLSPDTIMFLGDLFDGGREWATGHSESPEKRYRSYRELFWIREYERFARLFFRDWRRQDGDLKSQRIIASLPGNHDLGIGLGIQLPVRDRFNAYFGDGSRVDVLGNHTIVSIDSVSLSALGQDDHASGAQGNGLGDGPESAAQKIWKPAVQFLDQVQDLKKAAVRRELSGQLGDHARSAFPQDVEELPGPQLLSKREVTQTEQPVTVADFPTILLTHVPLYRPEGTPCGPQREHWPPTKPANGQKPLEKDDRNAIAVRGGYQYQNVLTPEISKDLVEKVGNVGNVFSGDDHDYCEVLHKSYTSPSSTGAGVGGIREITVKSISWAMGVRKPGFLLVSLWNPVDSHGQPTGKVEREQTVQSQLCLLPDQLGIFIRYGLLIAVTLLSILGRSILVETHGLEPFAGRERDESEKPVLPTIASSNNQRSQIESHSFGAQSTILSPSSSAELEKSREQRQAVYPSHSPHSSNSSQGSSAHHAGPNPMGLSVRSSAGRPRSSSPNGGYGLPASQLKGSGSGLGIHFGSASEGGYTFKAVTENSRRGAAGGPGRLGRIAREVQWSLWRVVWMAFAWYFWLAWRG